MEWISIMLLAVAFISQDIMCARLSKRITKVEKTLDELFEPPGPEDFG